MSQEPTSTPSPALMPHVLPADDPYRRLRLFVYALLIAAAGSSIAARIVAVTRLTPAREALSNHFAGSPFLSVNDRSRWATVYSLVHHGTYHIDELHDRIGWDTIDKVRGVDGHYYSSKPPLLPTLLAGEYWLLNRLFDLDMLRPGDAHHVVHIILLTVNGIPFVIFLILLAAFVERHGTSNLGRVFVVASASFATLLIPFSITLNNHTIAAYLAFFAVYPALRIWYDDHRCPHHLNPFPLPRQQSGVRGARLRWFALTGFFAGFATTMEFTAGALLAGLFCLLVSRFPARTLLAYLPAALIPLAALVLTNYLATRDATRGLPYSGLAPIYYYFDTEIYEYDEDGLPSYWTLPVGIDAADEPKHVYLFHMLLGHRGILSLSPIFLFTLAAFVWQLMRRGRPLAAFSHFVLAITIAVLAFYVVQSNNYGGVSIGLRWTLWLIPLWFVATLPFLDAVLERRAARWLAIAALAVSVFSANYSYYQPWDHPWLYRLMERWGLVSYPQPEVPDVGPLPHAWIRSIPPDGAWVQLEGYSNAPPGRTVLRLEAAGTQDRNGRTARRLIVRWGTAAQPQREHSAEPSWARTLDVWVWHDAVRRGADPAQWLATPNQDAETGANEAHVGAAEALRFLRGLPGTEVQYAGPSQPWPAAWVRTRIRRDETAEERTFQTVLLSASASQPPDDAALPPGHDHELRYVRRLYVTPDPEGVPFGTVRIEDEVYNSHTGEVLSRSTLTLRAWGGPGAP